MRMNAVLSNPKHPEYGQFTVPLPIPHNQYDGIMEALNAMDMGDPLARDCQMDEILGEYPILKRLEGKPVNIDELDYLAKRLDSFCYAQEGAQFQGAAVSYDYSDMTDLINLTFSCQQVTVITDFSDLEQVGRDHYMVLNGGCASKEELDALDGYETALLLIDEGNGVITPYGVSVSGPGSAQGTIQCKIVDLDENPPPNPVADDRNDSFSPSAVPSRAEKTSAQWSIWRPWWYAYWVWHSTGKDSGYWCDHGWWEFDLDRYSASLSASMTITPDTMNPTASGTTMKSGYGINEVVTARVSSSQRSATTALQNAVSYFPEFNYDSFWRLLDRVSISSSSSRLEFQTNEYSTYNRRTHFTPIWYPDGAYTVNTWVIDCWTPVGMLSVNLSDTLTISGNLWDDWHIAPMR